VIGPDSIPGSARGSAPNTVAAHSPFAIVDVVSRLPCPVRRKDEQLTNQDWRLRKAAILAHKIHPVLFFIIGLIVWGFIVGGLARLALPGPDPMPWYATIGLGLAGSLVGGIIARVLIGTAGGVLFALLGAILLLYLYRRFVQHRGITGPSARRLP